jgi:hypothetical protein
LLPLLALSTTAQTNETTVAEFNEAPTDVPAETTNAPPAAAENEIAADEEAVTTMESHVLPLMPDEPAVPGDSPAPVAVAAAAAPAVSITGHLPTPPPLGAEESDQIPR